MFDRLLILSASAGAGHLRAAQAIERAVVAMGAAREVRHVDTLQHTNKVFRHLYAKAYLDLVNRAPELLGWLYDHLDTPWENERRRLALNKLNTGPFVKLLEAYRPDMVVCTHFLPAEIIASLRAKERLQTKQAIVVTDFDVHAMWLCRCYEHYFVAMEETREHLAKLGIAREMLTVSGIPIDPVFAEPKDKRAMRVKHGLDPERTTILVSAGGFGVGPIEHLLTSLAELKHPAQVVALCGKNESLKAKLEALVAGLPAATKVTIRPIGFTTEMDEYMSASDLVIGKPGGLTTSEALAKGLVFVIVNPIPGQEERNADHLLEQGAAIRCNNLPVLAYKVDALLADRARFEAMAANARRLGRPNAAETVVRTLLDVQKA